MGSPENRPYIAIAGTGCLENHSSTSLDPALTTQASAGWAPTNPATRSAFMPGSCGDLSAKPAANPAS
jgi:hypothetical protein